MDINSQCGTEYKGALTVCARDSAHPALRVLPTDHCGMAGKGLHAAFCMTCCPGAQIRAKNLPFCFSDALLTPTSQQKSHMYK